MCPTSCCSHCRIDGSNDHFGFVFDQQINENLKKRILFAIKFVKTLVVSENMSIFALAIEGL